MRARLGLLLLLGATLAAPARADFKVGSAEPYLQDRVLHVNTRLELALNAKTEEALDKGIPLDVVIDIQVVRTRWWWWNQVISDWTFRRRIVFHALSRQYLVTDPLATAPAESFVSLTQALAHLGDLSDLKLFLTAKKHFEPGARYAVLLRARLDIEALPTLMRPLAYATPSWHLGTGWSQWAVQP